MVLLPERPSAQPGLGVSQEHVPEVLICQHEHLHPLAGAGRYYLLSTHIEFSQIFKTLQIQIEFGALKLFRNSKSHNSE